MATMIYADTLQTLCKEPNQLWNCTHIRDSKRLLDEVFAIYGIINVGLTVISRAEGQG